MTPAEIAATYLGKHHRGNYSPERIRSLLRFPADGSRCRASVFCRHAHWKRLLTDGLVEGVIGDANITPLGLEVRAILEQEPRDGQ